MREQGDAGGGDGVRGEGEVHPQVQREVPRHLHHRLRAHPGEEVRDQLREELSHHLQTHG